MNLLRSVSSGHFADFGMDTITLAGPLEGYVGMVNGLRLELDGLMRSATVALDGE